MQRKQKPVKHIPNPVENNCKKLIRLFKGQQESADKTFAQLTTYANENSVDVSDLIQWFTDEGYTHSLAHKHAHSIIRVVHRASPVVKSRVKAYAENTPGKPKTTFKEAQAIVVQPTKSDEAKVDTKWKRELRVSIRTALINEVSKPNFLAEAGIIYDEETRNS